MVRLPTLLVDQRTRGIVRSSVGVGSVRWGSRRSRKPADAGASAQGFLLGGIRRETSSTTTSILFEGRAR